MSMGGLVLAILCGVGAVVFGVISRNWLLGLPAGTERMQAISGAIEEGAMAYMRRQYTTIAYVGGVLFLLLAIYLG